MMEIIGKITLPEVMLVFVLLFVLPGMAFLLHALRRYEKEFGPLPEADKKKKTKKAEPSPAPAIAALEPAVPNDVYPYRARPFLSSADRACLAAMREALGAEVEVFPKVALWETVEATDRASGYRERLYGKDLHFLVCDRKTGRPLTAVMYNLEKGAPAGPLDELKKICAAAKASVVFIDMAEEYDVKRMKDALGLPDLEI